MGRPLNKKYMGNRNVGTNSPTDDMIGGKGVASVSTATQGSININDTYKHFPALTASAPTIANGTTATFAVTWEIESITVGGTNTGYTASQTNAPVTALVGLYGQASVVPVLTINTNSSGNVSAINITSRGSFTSIDGTNITTWGIQGAGGSNAQATVKFRVKSIAVVNAGDGYVTAPALSWGTLNGTTPSGQTPTLTAASGIEGTSTSYEPAILAWAYTGGNLVEVDLQKQISAKRYRFNKTGEVSRTGTEIGRIKYTGVADGTAGFTAAEGVELNIVAVDASGGTYLVRKLYNRTCTVVPTSIASTPATAFGVNATTPGSVYTSGKQYKWTFGTPTADTVKILNA